MTISKHFQLKHQLPMELIYSAPPQSSMALIYSDPPPRPICLSIKPMNAYNLLHI